MSRICRHWQKYNCTKGDACNYLHRGPGGLAGGNNNSNTGGNNNLFAPLSNNNNQNSNNLFGNRTNNNNSNSLFGPNNNSNNNNSNNNNSLFGNNQNRNNNYNNNNSPNPNNVKANLFGPHNKGTTHFNGNNNGGNPIFSPNNSNTQNNSNLFGQPQSPPSNLFSQQGNAFQPNQGNSFFNSPQQQTAVSNSFFPSPSKSAPIPGSFVGFGTGVSTKAAALFDQKSGNPSVVSPVMPVNIPQPQTQPQPQQPSAPVDSSNTINLITEFLTKRDVQPTMEGEVERWKKMSFAGPTQSRLPDDEINAFLSPDFKINSFPKNTPPRVFCDIFWQEWQQMYPLVWPRHSRDQKNLKPPAAVQQEYR